MKKLCFLLIMLLQFSVIGQETSTPIQELRCVVHKTYDNGTKKQERFYKGKEYVKAINYNEDQTIGSIYYLSKGKNKEFIKYADYKKNFIDFRQTFYDSGKIQSELGYNDDGSPSLMYYMRENGEKKAEVKWSKKKKSDTTKQHQISLKAFYNKDGLAIKSYNYYNTGILKSVGHFHYGKVHGWTYRYNKDGSLKHKTFYANGVQEGQSKQKSYEGWEKEVPEYDSIASYELQLDAALKHLRLLQD